MPRKPKSLTQQETAEILALQPDDIDLNKIKNLFGNFEGKEARFLTNDVLTLPAKRLENPETIITTVGRFIFNLFMLTPNLIKIVGYQNKSMDSKAISALDAKFTEALLSEIIMPEEFINYIDKGQWLGFACTNFMTPSLGYDTTMPLKSVTKKKNEMAKELHDRLEAGDPKASSEMEKVLLPMAEEELKDNSQYEMYKSGTTKGFGNNYKNMSIMRGAIANNSEKGTFFSSTANLSEGIPKKDYHKYADILVMASYSRAIETRKGGYLAKQLCSAMQSVVLGEPGSDCGTSMTISMELTDKNKQSLMYRYIKQGMKLILLDEKEMPKYVGKLVNFRTPLFCTAKNVCSKCAGELYYRLGIKNIGLTTSSIGGAITNLSMKSFHDATVKYNKIDITKYII
jgi:hypothetical protein